MPVSTRYEYLIKIFSCLRLAVLMDCPIFSAKRSVLRIYVSWVMSPLGNFQTVNFQHVLYSSIKAMKMSFWLVAVGRNSAIVLYRIWALLCYKYSVNFISFRITCAIIKVQEMKHTYNSYWNLEQQVRCWIKVTIAVLLDSVNSLQFRKCRFMFILYPRTLTL